MQTQYGGESTTVSYSSTGSRVVQTGEQTVIGINTIQGEDRIISERVVEHEIKVPKKIVVEEVIEKIIIVPETITREEYIEEIQKITETIIEVAKPIIQQKIIEVHEIEYRDKIVERIVKKFEDKVREVDCIEYKDRIVEVPKIITREKIVEVPEIEYRDVIVEKIIHVPEYREQVVIKEVVVPQYKDVPVAEYRNIEAPYDVARNIPVPMEAVTTFEYQLVQFRPRVHKVQYPLYVPRFVEVPVAAELFDEEAIAQLQAESAKLLTLSTSPALSLCEVEKMATEFRRNDVTSAVSNMDLQAALAQAWQANSIQMKVGGPMKGSNIPPSIRARSAGGSFENLGVSARTHSTTGRSVAASNATSHRHHRKASSRQG